MPNWCSNTLYISGKKSTILALIERAASGGHRYVGPFNNRNNDTDWGAFTPIQMEALMKDDDLFLDKSEKSSCFSFHAFVPVPREVMLSPYDTGELNRKKAEYPEWFSRFPNLKAGYDWETENWSCKWGASSPMIGSQSGDDEDYTVEYSFDTPWGPPTDFMHSFALMYPSLSFTLDFREEGMGFEGQYVWSNGACIRMEDGEIEREEEEDEWEENSYELCPTCQASVLPEDIRNGKCPNCPK